MEYTKNENGELVIQKEEAEIVRLVFRLYLEGYSARKIGDYLEEKGIKTVTGNTYCHTTVITKMLNNGIVQQYYVEDDHEAIIPKELFYKVQEEMVALIAENAEVGSYNEEFDAKYRSIAEEINTLKTEQQEARRKKRLAEN